MTYDSLHLLHTARISPGWRPNNEARTPFVSRLSAPDWRLSRSPGDPAYLAEHVPTGEAFEIPLANVRSAKLAPAPATKGGKRA